MQKINSYYFDHHSLTYRPVRHWQVSSLILPMMRFRFTMLVIGLAFLCYGVFQCYRIYLHHQQDDLTTALHGQSIALAKLEHELLQLYHQDNGVYRSVLNAQQIDIAIWEGGVGGSEEVVLEKPDIVRHLNNRLERLTYKMSIQQASLMELHGLAERKKAELRTIPILLPVNRTIVSGFGHRCNPFHGGTHFHHGIDIAAPTGTPVRAAADGVITGSGYIECGYGVQVLIKHNNNYATNYAHLSRALVRPGQKVLRGDIIGYSGNTGYSTGPHLHYEIIRNGKKINPIEYCLVRSHRQLKS